MANQKTTELTADTSPVDADLVMTVDDVAGTPTNKKVTLANLAAGTPFSSRYQPLAAVLTGTTASFTTADETKLDYLTVTQAVDLDTIESRVNELDAAVVLKGSWDASAGSFPGAGAAQAGWSYIVSVGGTVDSQVFTANDRIVAITDNASTSTYASNWLKLDYTDAVLSVAGRTGAVTLSTSDVSGLGTAATKNTGTASGEVPLNSDLRTFATGVRTAPNTGTPGQIAVDVTLSGGISGGDTLAGGSDASDELTLASTSNATRGFINLRDRVRLISEDKTFSTQSDTISLFETRSVRTITLSSSNSTYNGVSALRFAPTVVFAASAAVSPSYLFNNEAVWKNDNGQARTVFALTSFYSAPTYRGDGATLTLTGTTGVMSFPVVDRINSGAVAITSHSGYVSSMTVGAGCTVTTLTHFNVVDAANSGTLTTQTGVSIPALSGATTNIGLSNGSSSVFPPGVTTITATTDTIRIDRTTVRLNNTSGSSKTLASTPTLAAGQAGQIIVIHNSSASDVVLQDNGTLAGSNLRLGATTRTIGQRDSIILMYAGSPTSAWIELAFSNVI